MEKTDFLDSEKHPKLRWDQPTYRFLARKGYCRCCGDAVERGGERVIVFWASRENVVLCQRCIEGFKDLIEKEGNIENKT